MSFGADVLKGARLHVFDDALGQLQCGNPVVTCDLAGGIGLYGTYEGLGFCKQCVALLEAPLLFLLR